MSNGSATRATTARFLAGAAVVVFASALIGALRGNELAATWFYDAAWWSYIVLADAIVFLRRGESLLLSRPRAFAALAFWSVVFWLVFEAANLRLENWYYVGVPRGEPLRTAGMIVSFATVLPGIFETGELLRAFGALDSARASPLHVPARASRWMLWIGVTFLVLPLCFPRFAFALIWGSTFFLCEAVLLARGADGVMSELARGRIDTPLRWLAAGLVAGLLWESWNVLAAAHWIYTVPSLEDAKLFEMPIAGFLGFPPFALECYSFGRVLVEFGLAPEWELERRVSPSRERPLRASLAVVAAIVFCAPVIAGVNAFTVRSTRAQVAEIAGASEAFVAACRREDIWSAATLLERAEERDTSARLRAAAGDRWSDILATARLMEVRGLGVRGVRALASAGVTSVEELASADPAALHRRIAEAHGTPSPVVTPAEVRVWVRGARDAGG